MLKAITNFCIKASRVLVPDLESLKYDTNKLRFEVVSNVITQKELFLRYQRSKNSYKSKLSFSDIGFHVFSQTDEDGILLYIFSLIGTNSKRCVEVAFGTPEMSNTTNLICNWGWHGLLLEGDQRLINLSQEFFRAHCNVKSDLPSLVCCWVTKENINSILKKHDFTGEIDLLSIDLNGNDYWIWQAIEYITPRVVVVEYRSDWSAKEAVTIPYNPKFNRDNFDAHYCGASLAAFVKLGHKKGYRLIGCNNNKFNAFFMKKGVGEKYFKEVSINDCLYKDSSSPDLKILLRRIKKYPWVKV